MRSFVSAGVGRLKRISFSSRLGGKKKGLRCIFDAHRNYNGWVRVKAFEEGPRRKHRSFACGWQTAGCSVEEQLGALVVETRKLMECYSLDGAAYCYCCANMSRSVWYSMFCCHWYSSIGYILHLKFERSFEIYVVVVVFPSRSRNVLHETLVFRAVFHAAVASI